MPTEETLKIFNEKCKKGFHPFEEIMSSGTEMEGRVARWCPVCGTAVVDVDYDGRTNAGQIMRARHPKILKRDAVEESIQSPSIKSILDSFRRLGGNIEIREDQIILDGKIIPVFVVKTYAENIGKVDTKKRLKVLVK